MAKIAFYVTSEPIDFTNDADVPMFFARTFTGLTALATGVFLVLLTTASLRATMIHAQSANTTNAAITLGTAFTLFICALFFSLPTARRRLVRMTFPALSRTLFVLLWLALFGLVAAMVMKSPNVVQSPLLFGASQPALAAAIGVLALAFLLTFLIPGFAYRELRAAYRAAALEQSEMGYAPATSGPAFEDRRGPVQKLFSLAFGLVAFGVIGAALYGLAYAQFISSAAHVAWVKEQSAYIIVGFGLVVLISFALGLKTPVGRRSALMRLRPVIIVFLSAILAFFSIPAAQTGIPAIVSLNEDGGFDRIEVTVVSQGKSSGRRSCDRRATVIWEVHNRQLCNVPESIWRDLKPGMRLELEGFLTDYGFRYEYIRRSS